MFRGLYTAWTGMANEQKRLDVISNNMANSNTVGYKDEKVARHLTRCLELRFETAHRHITMSVLEV